MISIAPIRGIGEVAAGADLGALVLDALRPFAPLKPDDILIVTQKIVSKAENSFADLSEIAPSARAEELASVVKKDARLVEMVLRESSDVVRAVPHVLITRHRLGFVMANAGIDQSNIGPGKPERVLLLPRDPDASAARLRAVIAAAFGQEIGVVISDSFGRPWRDGVVNVAIGAAGVASVRDQRGIADRDGRPLEVTRVALADAIAAAAGLASGEAAESVPLVLMRGCDPHAEIASPAQAINRPVEQDLFR